MLKLVGRIVERNVLSLDSTMPKPFKSGKFEKESAIKVIEYFEDKRKIKCIITDIFGVCKGMGESRCHPEDTFDLTHGIVIAELRARKDLYLRLEKKYTNKL